jgi:UDP-glucose 4-epimerase
MSKIIVTGGAGFIGSNIVDALISRGHKVVVIDNLSTGEKDNINPKAKFYKIDIRDKKISDIFKKEKPQAVFHYAAQIDARASARDPMFDAEINVLGSINVLESAAKSGVKKIVFASSGGSLSSEETVLPTPEDKISLPVSPYGAAKFSIEMYLNCFWKTYGMKYVALRMANVYGPRQSSHGEAGVVAIFTGKMLRGEQPMIFGSGRQTRDYIYVGDVVRANLLALKSNKVGSYNVGTGKETTVLSLFRKIKQLTGAKVREVRGLPTNQATKVAVLMPGEQQRSVLSFKKIQRELGWKPIVALDLGLKKTVEWFRKN